LLAFLSIYADAWEGTSGTEGCTYFYFLEYDPAANIDDGSCVTLDELICDYALYSLNLALPGGASGEPLTVPATGVLQSLDVTLDFDNLGGDNSWASDLRLEIGLPDGSCAALGGYNFFGECTDLGDGSTVWGVLWNESQEGLYTATVDLADTGLSGAGLWTFTALNGYVDSDSVNYGITLQVNGLCSPVNAACGNPDAIGVCGGFCTSDADSDGICDDVDSCVGALDACGVCNGPGAIYSCGCSDIPVGDCDCIGNQLDALGICGGTCAADVDGDGVCDDGDFCVGSFDACGVCNGPGDIYACGCSDIPAGDCDCNGNQVDALGVCGGSCSSDVDGDGICDDGDPALFQCGDEMNHQGHDYATVLIGDQCWFAENLRNEHYENGDPIPAGLDDSEWSSTTFGATAVYGEGITGCTSNSPGGDACDETWSLNEYGRLYNWHAVADARGLCPSGWHVPSEGEWSGIVYFLGGPSVAGGPMKTEYGWDINNGTNASGFSALPGGSRTEYGNFHQAGLYGSWWSSTSFFAFARYNYLYYGNADATSSITSQQIGFSVRCLKD
jgi:uncharacterized protein (TIGR02145 family)